MTKKEEIDKINEIQEGYVDQLIEKINFKIEHKDELYEINFGSDTGTGKSVMISKLLNKCPNLFFLITTLSRGGLNHQLTETLEQKSSFGNYVCYGSCDLTANTKKDAEDIWNEILEKNIGNKPIVWIRDEAHIRTNVFSSHFKKKVAIVVNISATNTNKDDIRCNFKDTIMLRHPKLYLMAHFDDAIAKLLEVKEQHKKIVGYNPCMVVRCLDEKISRELRQHAEEKGLKCVDLNDDNVSTLEICKDDCPYDVIINKMKIIEGVDIRRCHVIYIQNNIGKDSTNIQLVGRSRRNALLWRNDIDIFDPENKTLLEQTLISHIYYNNNKGLDQDGDGDFLNVCCNIVSVESLRAGSVIHVEHGKLPNGYSVYELEDLTGDYHIDVDPDTGFNIIRELSDLYRTEYDSMECHGHSDEKIKEPFAFVEGTDLVLLKKDFISQEFNYATGEKVSKFDGSKYHGNLSYQIMKRILPITETEFDTGTIRGRFPLYNDFKYVVTNKLFTELSGDTFTFLSEKHKYVYSACITQKVSQDCKLRQYLQNTYKNELETAATFTGHNNFKFDSKCNSCLGYLVEYYSKYRLLGESFLIPFLDYAIAEVVSLQDSFDFDAAPENIKQRIIIRACQLKYTQMMRDCYGETIASVIPSIKTSELIKEKYEEWINTIISLSDKVVKFIPKHMSYDGKTFPMLQCSGVKGVCDFVSEDTIIDLKTTNEINKKYLMQVLSYYELSKTRSDLHIKNVIVYDCVSDKFVEICLADIVK